jgi:thiamine-monophosphate kinase
MRERFCGPPRAPGPPPAPWADGLARLVTVRTDAALEAAEIAVEDGSVADLGEWGVIAALRSRMPAGALTSVGIGDDAAVVTAPSGAVVAAVDMLIEGRHFRRDWSWAHDVGVKAAARSLADIAAMGAVNTALLVALAAPGALPARWATELADGLAAEAARAGAGIVGGDTASADLVVLSVTALGDLEGRRPVLRSGARPGDLIAVAGPLGHSAAGLALLTAGIGPTTDTGITAGTGTHGSADSGGAGDELPPALAGLVAAHLRPSPPYDAGPEAARLGATAMIDTSDGLLSDLGHVAAASGVLVELRAAALAPGAALRAAAAALLAQVSLDRTGPADSLTPMTLDWVLTGGEDHALVAAFPPDTGLPGRWRVIGEVREGDGVTVDGAVRGGPGGWEHFR